MSKPRTERSRWTTIYTLPQPSAGSGPTAVARHDEAAAVVKAFDAVGRVVRVEPAKFGNGLVLKARRA